MRAPALAARPPREPCWPPPLTPHARKAAELSVVNSVLSKAFQDPMPACTRVVLCRHLLLAVDGEAPPYALQYPPRDAALPAPW